MFFKRNEYTMLKTKTIKDVNKKFRVGYHDDKKSIICRRYVEKTGEEI